MALAPSETLRSLHEIFEGRRHTAYFDDVGMLTIGIGHTNANSPRFRAGEVWTDDQINEAWRSDVAAASASVARNVADGCPQAAFDVLTDLVFNCGSTVMAGKVGRFAAQGEWEKSRRHVLDWINGGGVPLLGLIRRRIAGYVMWGGGDWREVAQAQCSSGNLAPLNDVIGKHSLQVARVNGRLRILRVGG